MINQSVTGGANIPQPHQGTCPNCGHCPHCGRSNFRPFQPWPYIQRPYTQPYRWYAPNQSRGISGGSTQQNIC